jgi:hypothetical protein
VFLNFSSENCWNKAKKILHMKSAEEPRAQAEVFQ